MSRPRCGFTAAHQAADGGHQLVGLLLTRTVGGAEHAVVGMIIEQAEGDLVKRRLRHRDLGEDVDAVAIVGDHPVCGMSVDRAHAQLSVYDGYTFYFCCDGCREQFEDDPARCLKGAQAPAATVRRNHDGHPRHQTIDLSDAGVHRHED